MRFRSTQILPLLLWLLFSSCLREKVVLEEFGPEPGLAVTGFISETEQSVSVKIERGIRAIGGNSADPVQVNNAQVYIYSANDSFLLEHQTWANAYIGWPSPGFFKAGNTYKLLIFHEGKEVYATTTLLHAYAAPIYLGSATKTIKNNETYYQIKLSWGDEAGKKNFYRVIPVMVYRNDTNLTDTMAMPFTDPKILVYTDNLAANGTLEIEEELLFSSFSIEPYKPYAILFYVLHIDEDYYEFHKDLMKFSEMGDFNNPVFLHSNINGGYGIFASSNGLSQKSFLLE